MKVLEAKAKSISSHSKKRADLQVKTILAPLDFSRASLHALKFTIALANSFKAAVHVVHVQRTDDFNELPGAGHLILDCADAVALMQDRLSEVQEKQHVRFVPDNCHVVTGRPHEEICRVATQIGADLIVLPTRGLSGLKRVALGSTAERVVRYAPCPVLIPRGVKFDSATWSGEPAETFSLRRILVPTDFSTCSMAGLEYAAKLARRFHAKLRLLYVIFPYTEVFQFDRLGGGLVSLIQNARHEAEKQMNKLRHLDFMNGIDCETEILTGSTVDTICGQSARDDVDLLVTATHGHTGFKHAMLGSAAEQIIRYAEAPVLIVPNRTAKN